MNYLFNKAEYEDDLKSDITYLTGTFKDSISDFICKLYCVNYAFTKNFTLQTTNSLTDVNIESNTVSKRSLLICSVHF